MVDSRWLRAGLALLICIVIANLPLRPDQFSLPAFAAVPAEIILVILAATLVRGRYERAGRIVLTAVFALVLLLKLADIGVFSAISRPFNSYLDGKLLLDGWRLLSATVGIIKALLLVATALLGFVGVGWLLYWSLSGLFAISRHRLVVPAAAILALGLTFGGTGALRPNMLYALKSRVDLVHQSIADMAIFDRTIGADPLADIADSDLLGALRGRDVVLIFVESYGEVAIRDPRYAARIAGRLSAIEGELAQAGLGSRSGWLVSPTVGGLSWLAHGTLLSGLWLDSQQRYDRMIGGGRASLNSLFRQAGWRSVAVMPAITMDWPESRYFGYDMVYAAKNLGYRGKPFNWVTMPDQYTLSAFERRERGPGHRPVMAEIALISSHAPWTPVPTLLDWSRIGDGSEFNEQAVAGEPPELVWRDNDRVRAHYIATIDYALQTVGSYMARHGRNTVFVILGDHQPAPIITGDTASRAVPIHIVADDAMLLDRLDGSHWSRGMRPAGGSARPRMDEFRESFVRTFSAHGCCQRQEAGAKPSVP